MCRYVWGMKAKKKQAVRDWESVKVSKIVVEKVRKNKEETYMPIGKFFELAAEEKLKRETK